MFAVEGNSYRVFESAHSDASDAMGLIVGTYFLAPACTTIIYYWICTLVEQGLIQTWEKIQTLSEEIFENWGIFFSFDHVFHPLSSL